MSAKHAAPESIADNRIAAIFVEGNLRHSKQSACERTFHSVFDGSARSDGVAGIVLADNRRLPLRIDEVHLFSSQDISGQKVNRVECGGEIIQFKAVKAFAALKVV